MFSQSIQRPARLAICALLKEEKTQSIALLGQIESDLHTRIEQVPSHLLLQNLHQEAQLLIDLFAINRKELLSNEAAPMTAIATFWRVLFQSLKDARSSSAVAESVTAPILLKIEQVIKYEVMDSKVKQMEIMSKTEEFKLQPSCPQVPLMDQVKGESAMLQLLINYLVAEEQTEFAFVTGDASTCSKDGQWLVQSLLLNSSQSARQQSLAIFKCLLSGEMKHLKQKITEMLFQYLDQSLENSAQASEEYFNLLTQLLTQEDESSQQKSDAAPKELKLMNTNQALFANFKKPE